MFLPILDYGLSFETNVQESDFLVAGKTFCATVSVKTNKRINT